MFDEMEIDYPISIPDYIPLEERKYYLASFSRNGFQTKDFDCSFLQFYVDENGFLYERLGSWNDQERFGSWNGQLDLEIRQYYTGYVNFCNIVSFTEDACWDKDAKTVFVDLNGYFKDGKLIELQWLQP